MGYAARSGAVKREAKARERTMLEGFRCAVDVQHLYRGGRHAGDRGAQFTLANGLTVWEADLALQYAASLRAWLRARGALVLENASVPGLEGPPLVGPYSIRHACASVWRADAYIACHVNAGGGSNARIEYSLGEPATTAGQLADRLALATTIAMELAKQFDHELTGGRSAALKHDDRGAVCIEGFRRGPAVICEPFFGDNAGNQALISSDGLSAVGQAIGRGVANWWLLKRTPPGATTS